MNRDVTVVVPAFRDAERAVQAALSIERQQIPEGVVQVLVVDDGSDDDLRERFQAAPLHRSRLLTLERNVGRAAARNAGAASADTEVIVFVDSDCLPADQYFVAAHVRTIGEGAVASAGHVRGVGGGFWDRYQAEASLRRQEQHAAGIVAAGSSQNLAVLRRAFLEVGGFDTGYRRYGFEDRDLLARMQRVGQVRWTPGAAVLHMDRLDLSSVARKLMVAGGESAARFAQHHPDLYRALGYDRIDLAKHPVLAGLLKPLLRGCLPAARFIDPWLERRVIPYSLRRLAVRCVSAAAFAAGSTARPSSERPRRKQSSKSP